MSDRQALERILMKSNVNYKLHMPNRLHIFMFTWCVNVILSWVWHCLKDRWWSHDFENVITKQKLTLRHVSCAVDSAPPVGRSQMVVRWGTLWDRPFRVTDSHMRMITLWGSRALALYVIIRPAAPPRCCRLCWHGWCCCLVPRTEMSRYAWYSPLSYTNNRWGTYHRAQDIFKMCIINI